MPQYSIFDVILIENPDFDDLTNLTKDLKIKLVAVAEDITASIQSVD
jgi:hypothetical protein